MTKCQGIFKKRQNKKEMLQGFPLFQIYQIATSDYFLPCWAALIPFMTALRSSINQSAWFLQSPLYRRDTKPGYLIFWPQDKVEKANLVFLALLPHVLFPTSRVPDYPCFFRFPAQTCLEVTEKARQAVNIYFQKWFCRNPEWNCECSMHWASVRQSTAPLQKNK